MFVFLVFLLSAPNAQAAFPLSLHGARAVWENRQEITYRPSSWFPAHSVRVESLDTETGRRLPLEVVRAQERWTLKPAGDFRPEEWLRQAQVLTVTDFSGNELDRTYFQLGGLIDDVYHYDGCLGVCWEGAKPTLKVWAPTAVRVSVIFEKGVIPMKLGGSGVWALEGDSSWRGRSYHYEVEVFTPITGQVEKHTVTDPYSLLLTENSRASVIYQPNFKKTLRPPFASRGDAVLYELHVREFSSSDETIHPSLRGTYGAFTVEGSAGDEHLRALARAGVTHIHLLPVQDFSSVDENPAQRRDPALPRGLPSDSPVPQQEVLRVRSVDSFNWGYDPFHYFAPEGSYAQDPLRRVEEFRALVDGLHDKGLRVVLDVVYNHTFAAGLAPQSVLDKIVPGYYYRLDQEGNVRNASCCSDTASERWMMEKLMRDSLESWRTVFGVDGFRFDLMNFHSVATMARLRDYLRAKDPSLLLYGEAWHFGSLFEQAPAEAFTQSQAFGQEIGVFNDRIRDAIRGGTTDTKGKSDQGFVTGLFYDFNHEPANNSTPIDMGAQRDKLLYLTDVVRVGLAGNLRDYSFKNVRGEWTTGGQLPFWGGVTGFAKNPEETINYVSAHDGYTLFDALQAKLPFHTRWREPPTTMARERMERQILAVGLIALSQGIPFFDSGVEILRSKSGDQNSYDSGDWFNHLDWSMRENGWGRGLPPESSNPGDWPFWRPRLAEEALRVGPEEIRGMNEAFLQLLALRKSSPLFRLRTGAEIQRRVKFLETELGPMQRPGLIVMEIQDEAAGADLDPRWKRMLVAFNVTNEHVVFAGSFLGDMQRLFGQGEARAPGELVLPPRSLTVWGERP